MFPFSILFDDCHKRALIYKWVRQFVYVTLISLLHSAKAIGTEKIEVPSNSCGTALQALAKSIVTPSDGSKPKGFTHYKSFQETEKTVAMEYFGKWGTHPRFTQHWVARDRRYEGDTYETQVLTFEPRRGWPPDVTQKLQSKDFSHFTNYAERAMKYWDAMGNVSNEQWKPVRQTIQEAVNFAKLHDKNRRHWPDSFLSQLDNMAFNNIRGSTYVIVRDKGNRNIITTLRVFQSSHERSELINPDWRPPEGSFESVPKAVTTTLSRSVDFYFSPEAQNTSWGKFKQRPPYPLILEQYLPITVERPVTWITLKNEKDFRFGVGRVYEPGLWAIDTKANEIGITESLVHLLDSIIENREHLPEEFNQQGKMLYTYGDKIGVRLYSQL